jgi:nitroreductase
MAHHARGTDPPPRRPDRAGRAGVGRRTAGRAAGPKGISPEDVADAGHLAQNLVLVSAALDIRTGLVGGFYDDLANDLFRLDGVHDTITYLLPLAA